MPNISQASLRLPTIRTEVIGKLAAQLSAQGHTITSLVYGMNTLPIPRKAAKAGAKTYQKRKNPYAPSQGLPELREACAQRFQAMGLKGCGAEDVVVGSGTLELLDHAILAALDPGDQGLLVSPYYFLYPYRILKAGGEVVLAETTFEDGYKLTPEKLKRAIATHPRLKFVILNTPNNPSGAMYSRLELTDLAEVLADTNLWVFADEVYNEVTYGKPHISPAGISDDMRARTVTFDSASKIFALGGERVGWATGPNEFLAQLIKHKTNDTFSTSLSGQRAVAAAMADPKINNYLNWMRGQFLDRRDYLVGIMRRDFPRSVRFHVPEGTFYLSFELPEGITVPGSYPADYSVSMRFSEYLLRQKYVAVTPGEAAGTNNLIRLSFAVDMQELRSASLIGEALKECGAA